MPSISELFIKEAIKTESRNFEEIAKRLTEQRTIRLLHAATGMVDEAAEFLAAIRKYIFYNKEIDLINIKEELGDSNWFQAIAHDEIGSTFEEIMILVVQKLKRRYNEKSFSSENAINRDLSSERNELEKKIDLVSGFGIRAKRCHYLIDTETLAVACHNKHTGDEFTLETKLVTCTVCLDHLSNKREKYSKDICGNE